MNFKHGHSRTPEHNTWCAIHQRCTNPKYPRYARYGGRGITVDPRWNTFAQFFADMGPRPSSTHSIERRDNNGPYSPENCVWATARAQANNRGGRRANVLLTYRGETLNVTQWAARTDLSHTQIRNRLRKGWTAERILTTPIDVRRRAKTPGGWLARHQSATAPICNTSPAVPVAQRSPSRMAPPETS